MKIGFKRILLFLGFGIVLLTIISVIISRTLMGSEIKLNEEKIPSLYEVVGKSGVYKINSSEKDILTKTFYYRSKSISVDDLNKYINYLIDSDFITTKDFVNNSGQLGKISKEKSKIILVDIKYSEEGSVIKYTKKIGKL